MSRWDNASPEDKLKYTQESIQAVIDTGLLHRRPFVFKRFIDLLESIIKTLSEIEMQIRSEKE